MYKHSKMGNKNLRKAMLYAVNLDKINKKKKFSVVFNGALIP